MRWETGRQSENLEDRRRMSGGTMALGGGGAIIVVILALLLGVDPRAILQFANNPQPGPPVGGVVDDRPETAEEAHTRKFSATILAFTEDVWSDLFQRAGERYQPPKMVLFTRRVESGCGIAPAAVGPFYCPRDRTVYLDPTFFDELEQRLGGSKAEFSQAYVIAHEVGHHVQNLLGYNQLAKVKQQSASDQEEANRWSVRLELQADYLAGVWAHYGQEKFNFIEPGDIDTAIHTSQAIGDDRIQERSAGFVSPEKYTHGTAAQRSKWFRLGLETGDLSRLKEIFEMPYSRL